MTQSERLEFLINYLISEYDEYRKIALPKSESERFKLFRSLVNVRPAQVIGDDFLKVQDDYLQALTAAKGITDIDGLSPVADGIYIWQGDITTLKCGAIVNAANSGMTGCYAPCHGCIDNAIHTFAGVQLRQKCAEIMARQGHGEPTGRAKITPAYNLPCDFILHTVGPFVRGNVTENDCELFASCYRSCLKLAQENGIKSVAFCCISTGEFHFPNDLAAEIAIKTVKEFKKDTKVIFNVFKDDDRRIYQKLLRQN